MGVVFAGRYYVDSCNLRSAMTQNKRILFSLSLALVTTLFVSEAVRADRSREEHAYPDVAAIEKWAKQSYLGSKVQRFAKGERELVVVSGLRTSGVATTQLVVLGRREVKSDFRELLKTATFMRPVNIRQAKGGVTVEAEGKMVLQIPFDLVALEVHSAP
jgi:hypothetical protein